ncbi:CRP-like cAMP-binding protein [Ulvibacter sp. MAR_2010_11]|uniref:Crp/Fnr family transcriptional regulator n=1 Tax=Ulvibacter sp. MAR_2010_11 TaxID=1250229 RepID=UPI000C2C932F|nr:Crp/Fnr family transcriptional regulator [Ulvibacter sp. MAR_2010_11]PKA83826.1 CRP-like cAMP-binding protein [Ulvibacter sp. MAR_2010_11]
MTYNGSLIANIKELVSLTEADEAKIVEKFSEKKLIKKEFLLQKDEISCHMRFIAQGALRSYYMDEQGKDHILQLGIENWWINDLFSYLTQTPAKHYIQAVEPSVVLQIHREDLENLYTTVPVMERFFRLKIQRGYTSLQERTINSMSESAEEQYLNFISKYKQLEQRFPQYMIASYLNITPEFLSALRKKLIYR